jgi:hypothetical protein
MDLNRARVAAACDQALARCRAVLRFDPQFDVAVCINQEKNDIKQQFANVPDIEGLVENHNWNLPAQGGKRKSTRKSTRKSPRRKNTRKNRRSSRKF